MGGTFSAAEFFGGVDDATVSDAAANYTNDNLEWILANIAARVAVLEAASGGGGSITLDHSTYSDEITVSAGESEVIFTLAGWDTEGSNNYDRVFVTGQPVVYNESNGAFYTEYVTLLDGWTTGSHRGGRIVFSESLDADATLLVYGVIRAASGEAVALIESGEPYERATAAMENLTMFEFR